MQISHRQDVTPRRGSPASRIRRLRVSWFILGTLFGVGVLQAGGWVKEKLSGRYEEYSVADLANLSPSAGDSSVETLPASEKEAYAPAAEPPALQWPREVDVVVSRGDLLLPLLTEQGIAFDDAHRIILTLRKTFNPRKLRAGHHLQMILSRDESRNDPTAAKLDQLVIVLSKIEQVEISRTGENAYEARKTTKPVQARLEWRSAPIVGSLYLTAKKHNIPDAAIMELIRAYSYDVDFQRDIKEGDEIELLYEKIVTEDGDYIKSGDVLFAELNTRGRAFRVYEHMTAEGNKQFYNEKGESVKKALLRTPVDGARLSSGFGMRKHPVLGYSRMHKGVDFAAPTGTPIYAAGDGVIAMAGRHAGYGNYLKIKHNSTYSTAYGHISRFGRGIRSGIRVKQGQVVAYVGATGLATGPHLHYEIQQAGVQVNPARVKFAGGDRLAGRELARFEATKRKYETHIAEMRGVPTQVAARR